MILANVVSEYLNIVYTHFGLHFVFILLKCTISNLDQSGNFHGIEIRLNESIF